MAAAVGARYDPQGVTHVQAGDHRSPAAIVQAGDEAPLLETQLEPGRELALFDDLRFWAYKQEKGSSRSGWGGRVLARAILRNPLLPDPLDLSEIRSTARSIADWTFGGKGAFNHSPDVQGRRGRAGGKRWRVGGGAGGSKQFKRERMGVRDALTKRREQ